MLGVPSKQQEQLYDLQAQLLAGFGEGSTIDPADQRLEEHLNDISVYVALVLDELQISW